MTQIVSLTLSLDDWKPRIWRRIWVKDNTRLDILSEILYTSMFWCGCHLSEIRTKYASYGDTSIEDSIPGMLNWRKYTVKDILEQKVTQFKYYYDFGDSWEMTVKIKLKPELDSNAHYPVCVNGENAPPPEDVGGNGGFEYFISIMNNPKHKEYKSLSKWWGDSTFDPTHFSTNEVNDLLFDIK